MADNKSWMDSISEAVDKATKAASEAWEGTADARRDAWDKTKAAVDSASDAIDQGVDKARESFRTNDASTEETATADGPQEPGRPAAADTSDEAEDTQDPADAEDTEQPADAEVGDESPEA